MIDPTNLGNFLFALLLMILALILFIPGLIFFIVGIKKNKKKIDETEENE